MAEARRHQSTNASERLLVGQALLLALLTTASQTQSDGQRTNSRYFICRPEVQNGGNGGICSTVAFSLLVVSGTFVGLDDAINLAIYCDTM